ncbi:MAG: sensor histidine kinase [Alkalispirochaeta sp.]
MEFGGWGQQVYREMRRAIRWYAPVTITVVYFLFGVLWIFGSDSLAAGIAESPEMFRQIEVYKGIVYVVITTVLLFFLLNDYARRIGRAFDQARHKRLELAENVREKEALIRELNHRVRNNLQIVGAIVRLSTNGDGGHHGDRILQRIDTLAYVQDEQLSNGDAVEVPLSSVVNAAVSELAHIARARGMAIDRIDAACTVPVEEIVPVGLVVSELLDNAIRYSSFEGRSVTVELSAREDRIDCIIENESVCDPSEITDGPGLTIARALASRMDGTISFEQGASGGIRGILRIPVQ